MPARGESHKTQKTQNVHFVTKMCISKKGLFFILISYDILHPYVVRLCFVIYNFDHFLPKKQEFGKTENVTLQVGASFDPAFFIT